MGAEENNIPSTFFIQTHVPYRLPASGGRLNMESALSLGHNVEIHTGSDGDHMRHTDRVELQPYGGGQNALESDLIRAKSAIANLAGGVTPRLVRAPYGALGTSSVRANILATYARQNLTHAGWDIDSTDSSGSGASVANINAALTAQIPVKLAAGDYDLVILFHDIRSVTADNLQIYLQTIKTVIESSGQYQVVWDNL